MRILILGATGMLGHTLVFELSRIPSLTVFGACRDPNRLRGVAPEAFLARLRGGLEASDIGTITAAMDATHPDVVVNAVGLIRQLPEGREAIPCITINALFPHLLLKLCRQRQTRLIHISTDCVFDGQKSTPYSEEDPLTARDIYGITKFMGELHEPPAVTLRTSIIGHELRNHQGLLEWFLSQQGAVNGFARTIYSGLPTDALSRVIAKYILPRPTLSGLFQVASEPISKYELLRLVAATYGKNIEIRREEGNVENKALSYEKLHCATGYVARPWPTLVAEMRRSRQDFLAGGIYGA